jgi:acetoin utilization protein AcuB
MLVKDYMTRHPIMIEPQRRIMDAQRIMTENRVRHLPVVGDGKRLLGLITRQRLSIAPERLGSLDVWEITHYLAGLTVEKVMVKKPDLKTIDPHATIEEAAELMISHRIGALPVVENEIVLGVISQIDLLIELQNLLGANDDGWRVTMRVPDRSGETVKLTSAISDQGWGIMALGSVRTPKTANSWDIVVKVRGCSRDELASVLESIPDQQILDIREATAYTTAKPV